MRIKNTVFIPDSLQFFFLKLICSKTFQSKSDFFGKSEIQKHIFFQKNLFQNLTSYEKNLFKFFNFEKARQMKVLSFLRGRLSQNKVF